MNDIVAITMPRWGLTMEEGTLTEWLAELGETIAQGAEVAEIETSKLAGAVEAPAAGVLRRQVAEVGQVLPCGSLLGILSDREVSEEEIDAFAEAFVVVDTAEEDEQETAGPQTVTVGGQTLSYLRKGAGRPVLFIHGFGGNAAGWAFIQDALAASYDTLALDLPGHGASSKQIADGSLSGQARVLAGFIAALELGQVDVIAHSMGGGIALALAAAHPELVGNMVLIAPMGLGREINAAYLAGFAAAEKQRDIGKILAELFADPGLVSRQMIDEIQRYKRVDGVAAALAAINAAIAPGGTQADDLTQALAAHTGKIAVIWGQADQIIPPAHAPANATIIPDAGHMPQAEAAPKVVEIVRDTLGR